MATVSSSSTRAQIEASFDDNASYAEDNSVTKARAFVTAGRILLRRYAEQSTLGATSLRRNLSMIKEQVDEAVQWLQQHDTAREGGRYTVATFDGRRE